MADSDFRQSVKEQVAKAAAYCCSLCRRSTLRPIEGTQNTHYIGTIAHISAKSADGPRYRPELSDEQRRDADNAIFLCWNCHNVLELSQRH
jgi:hypothetical protein